MKIRLNTAVSHAILYHLTTKGSHQKTYQKLLDSSCIYDILGSLSKDSITLIWLVLHENAFWLYYFCFMELMCQVGMEIAAKSLGLGRRHKRKGNGPRAIISSEKQLSVEPASITACSTSKFKFNCLCISVRRELRF